MRRPQGILNHAGEEIHSACKRLQGISWNHKSVSLFTGCVPLSPRSVTSLYNKYCDKLDIIHKTSHKTRKTFISALIDGKVNLNTIRELVGHADERTTLKNYCFDRNTEEGRQKQIENALAS